MKACACWMSFVICVTLLKQSLVSCNLFTGVESLKKLSEWEEENLDLIEEYIRQEENKIQLLKL